MPIGLGESEPQGVVGIRVRMGAGSWAVLASRYGKGFVQCDGSYSRLRARAWHDATDASENYFHSGKNALY